MRGRGGREGCRGGEGGVGGKSCFGSSWVSRGFPNTPPHSGYAASEKVLCENAPF